MANPLSRLGSALRSEGPRSVVRRAAQRGAHQVFLREEHMWYTLALAGERPKRPLPEGFDLQTATQADAEAIAQLPNQADAETLAERIGQAADVYVVREEGKPAFACTIFRERAPVYAARGGWLELPEDTICLEDSGTSPDFRGRGVAPAAWSTIADALQERGYATMITKVELSNEPSRRAVSKAGFQEAAIMRLRRSGPRTRVSIEQLGPPGAAFMQAALTR